MLFANASCAPIAPRFMQLWSSASCSLAASRSASGMFSMATLTAGCSSRSMPSNKMEADTGVECDIHAFKSTWRTVNSGSSSAGRCESMHDACLPPGNSSCQRVEDALEKTTQQGPARNSPGSGMTRFSSVSRIRGSAQGSCQRGRPPRSVGSTSCAKGVAARFRHIALFHRRIDTWQTRAGSRRRQLS